MLKFIFFTTLLLFSGTLFAFNLQKLELINCYDGDTCKFNILDNNFPNYLNPMLIRVYGVDTAEIKGKGNKELAKKAKHFTENFVKNAKNLQITNCIKDKYFRFTCTYKDNEKILADELIKNNLGKPYFGGKK